MEKFAKDLRKLLKNLSFFFVPHFRQVLRFLALPYCYFFLVNWNECTASRLQVIRDFAYIFFVLRYFPDNYSVCRLYEIDRREWVYYYGSNYNPYQRGKLIRLVQPQEYQIVFEDKEVCQKLCEGHGIHVPRSPGVLAAGIPLHTQLQPMLGDLPASEFFAKPVTGSAGQGVLLVRRMEGGFTLFDQKGSISLPPSYCLAERHLIQEKVLQHGELEAIHAASVNSIRVLTLFTSDGESLPFRASMRFGVGTSHIDNWSAGGVGVGIDCATGRLGSFGYDKKGRRHPAHPDSGITFRDFQVPLWDQVLEFSKFVQGCFPFYRLLGLDIAIGPERPILLEINAYPDFMGNEQKTGPFLKDPVIYREFAKYDLLFNRLQKKLVFPPDAPEPRRDPRPDHPHE